MKKLIIAAMALVTVFTPLNVHAQVRPETAVIVGTYYGRHADCGIVTVELSDGNEYDVPHAGEDWMRGDIVAVNRDTKGTPTAIDDDVTIVAYLGYEVWYPEHMWVFCGHEEKPMF